MKSKGSIIRQDGVEVHLYIGEDCDSCKLKPKCTKAKNRQIGIDPRIQYRTKMREKLATDKGRFIYSKTPGDH